MTKGKAVTFAVILIVILTVFVILASLGGKKVLSPVPEEPKIIWIKPSPSMSPSISSSPVATSSSKPKVLVTAKPASTVAATVKPTVSPSPNL